MASLHAKGKKGGKSMKKGGKSKMKQTILDLDNSDNSDNDDDDDVGIMEKEKRSIAELQRALSRCQLCGPTKFCKIGKNGQHVTLTFHQLRGWALALVLLLSYHLPL